MRVIDPNAYRYNSTFDHYVCRASGNKFRWVANELAYIADSGEILGTELNPVSLIKPAPKWASEHLKP